MVSDNWCMLISSGRFIFFLNRYHAVRTAVGDTPNAEAISLVFSLSFASIIIRISAGVISGIFSFNRYTNP